MDKLRVFLVDDHPLIRMATSRILEADGRFLIVGEADNAEDAVRILDTLVADLGALEGSRLGLEQRKNHPGHLGKLGMTNIPSVESPRESVLSFRYRKPVYAFKAALQVFWSRPSEQP